MTAYLPSNPKEARYKRLAYGDKDTKDSYSQRPIWREANPQHDPETIDDEEAEWLVNAKNSMSKFAKNGYEGYGIQKDVRSFYPLLMAQPELQIPMKRPTYHTYDEDHFDDEESNAMCGICRAEIKEDSLLFRKRNTNHYSSWDIMCAIKKAESHDDTRW